MKWIENLLDCQTQSLGSDYVESHSAEKDLEVIAGDKLNTKQQCAFAAKKPKSILGRIGKSIASQSRQVDLEYSVQFGVLQYKYNVGILQQVRPGMVEGWRTWPVKKYWESSAFLSWRREGSGNERVHFCLQLCNWRIQWRQSQTLLEGAQQ